MFGRQKSGSVVCPSCGKLVGVGDQRCYNCGRLYPGMWGFTPLFRRLGEDMGFTQIVIGGSLIVYLLTLLYDPSGIRMGGLFNFLGPSGESLFTFGAAGPAPVIGFHRWWTLLSAGWLHGGLLHIAFNLYWVTQFGPAVAHLYGPGRMVIIYTVGSVAGFALSSVSIFAPTLFLVILGGGGGITIGASAALFGLLGAMVHYGRRVSGAVGRQALVYAALFFIFGLLMRGVDNWAHLGGFAGGYVASHLLDPMRPERTDHLIAAVVCLAASAAAVVVSFITAQGLRLGP